MLNQGHWPPIMRGLLLNWRHWPPIMRGLLLNQGHWPPIMRSLMLNQGHWPPGGRGLGAVAPRKNGPQCLYPVIMIIKITYSGIEVWEF